MGMTTEQKLVSVMLKLKKMKPFYGIVYSHLEKIDGTEYIGTMGVNSRQLIYNKDFVDNTPLDELIFVNLHEIAHISLLHPSRIGERNHFLFNVACDLYVNALLSKELGIEPGKSTSIEGINIKMPTDLLYSKEVDIDVDYVEGIYENLRSNKNSYGLDLDSNVDGNSNNCSSCNGGNSKETDENGNKKKSTFGSDSNNGKDTNRKGNKKKSTFGLTGKDIIPDKDKNAQDKIKKILIDASTRAELAGENGSGNILLKIKEVLAPKVDWRTICKKYLIADLAKETSFRTTDKRMSYQDCIFPGNKSVDNFKLESLKICIDTSGSIGSEDLGVFYAQVKQLLKKYKVSAEVLYWDTEVSSKGNINNLKDFNTIKVAGGGGTDPSCLFEYFSSKKCKVKPKLTLIFTDGYIYDGSNLRKYGSKYKDTVWIVVPSGNKGFKAPFGKTVKFYK